MLRSMCLILFVATSVLANAHQASAQDSKAAKATRDKIKQKITVEFKDIGTKAIFDEVLGELEKPVKFKIDNASGISNNSKLTYKAKDKSAEQILNELSDMNGFGWYVVSNVDNNKIDGWIIIRKSEKGKERGYEAGKEPKKSSSVPPMSNERTVIHREPRVYAWHRAAFETYYRNLSAVQAPELVRSCD